MHKSYFQTNVEVCQSHFKHEIWHQKQVQLILTYHDCIMHHFTCIDLPKYSWVLLQFQCRAEK